MRMFYSGGREEKLLERILDRPDVMITYWKTFENRQVPTKDVQRLIVFKRREKHDSEQV